jgi:hypothetical protein
MKVRHAAALALVRWPRFLRGKIDWGLIVSLAFVELILAVVGIVVLYYIVGWLLFGNSTCPPTC